MRLTNLYQLILIICLLPSCTAIDKEEQVPSYIFIDKISLSVNPDGSQGSNAHDIKDAWILANGELIGVFELPCRVPILKKDSVEIIVFGGIKVNGKNNDRKFYPFYDIYKKVIFMEPAVIDSISPVLTYKSSVKFNWVEDFEDFSISLEKTGITRTVDTLSITNLPSEVFEFNKPGNKYSGKVNFRSKKGTFENTSIEIFDLPRLTSDIYLEVNYKSDVPVQFGLYPTSGTAIDFGIPIYFTFSNPKEWKKAYIRMSDDVNSPENVGKKFRIFINAVNNEDKFAVILLDNLKLLHF